MRYKTDAQLPYKADARSLQKQIKGNRSGAPATRESKAYLGELAQLRKHLIETGLVKADRVVSRQELQEFILEVRNYLVRPPVNQSIDVLLLDACGAAESERVNHPPHATPTRHTPHTQNFCTGGGALAISRCACPFAKQQARRSERLQAEGQEEEKQMHPQSECLTI